MFPNTKISYIILSITFLIFVGAVVVGLRYVTSAREKNSENVTSAQSPPGSDAEVLEKIGSHIVLPPEQPRIVTIENVEDLRQQQPFFILANNGDKLLVYSTRVILYDPKIDKVVDIAQIRIDTTPTPQPN